MKKIEKTKRIIIGNNNIIKSFTCEYGTCGAGGSNTSGDLADYIITYDVNDIKNIKIIEFEYFYIVGVINDVIYLRNKFDKSITEVGTDGIYFLGDKVAYDTYSYIRISIN